MEAIQFKRESHHVTATAQSVDPAGLAGRWSSSDPLTRGIASIHLTVRDGVVEGHTFGAGQDGLVDWGVAPVTNLFTGGVSSASCAGFQLRCDLDFLTAHIQANLKLGVLVLGVHQSFRENNGRNNYFFREFMPVHESETEPLVSPLGSQACNHDDRLGGSTAALNLILGSWKNTNQASQGIAGIELEVSGDQVQVRVLGASEGDLIDWGECSVEIFTCDEEDGIPSAAVLARYDFGFFDCELQIRQNKGILAVTTFNRFHDESGRNDYVSRELFHRSEKS